MKLGTIDNGTRDGQLVVANRELTKFLVAADVAPTLQFALDNWDTVAPALQKLANGVSNSANAQRVEDAKFRAPLPRAYEWVDGSAYINHVKLVRKARGAEPPPTLQTDPLVYQGGSGVFLGPRDPIELRDLAWGGDFESEVCVILGDTPQGTKAQNAHQYVRLVMLANDVSLRNLIPDELAKGFGFFCSKPATAFSPFCVTPDEISDHWRDGRVHLPLCTWLNSTLFGDPNAGREMHFSFFDLIEHITKTRSYTAGTILGSGTVSNEDRARGSSCLAEKRMIEIIDTGSAKTEFLRYQDRVRIEMKLPSGESVFGAIDQVVQRGLES